ncbi:MAG: hypothetical protein K2X08_07075 [Chlamydiales bacterium]|nr:hypothetical protein [Chlamydiales bacterium]
MNSNLQMMDEPWLFWIGPGSILSTCTAAIWLEPQNFFYWLSLSLLGLFLCSCYKMRGCIYAVGMLALVSAVQHGWLLQEHLLSIGLEGALACSFLIVALASAQRCSALRALQETLVAGQSAIGHLEQNIAALMSSSQAQQVGLQEKIAQLQKDQGEMESELSSIVILNEVLRKNSAAQLKNVAEKSEALLDRERRIGCLIKEREDLFQELERIKKDSSLTQENKRLLDELNARRLDEAQVQCMGETLSALQDKLMHQEELASERLQALSVEKERLQVELEHLQKSFSQKAELELENGRLVRELDQAHANESEMRQLQEDAAKLREQLIAQEKQLANTVQGKNQKLLEEEISSLRRESLLSQVHIEQLSDELAQSLNSLQSFEQLQMEKNALQERLRLAEVEIANLMRKVQPQPSSSSSKEHSAKQAEREVLLAKLAHKESYLAQLEERLKKSSHIESLYSQLKAQFEEKNTALHETRSQLFYTDTQLQKLHLEIAHKELEAPLFSPDWEKELSTLEQELHELKLENEGLQQVISELMKSSS